LADSAGHMPAQFGEARAQPFARAVAAELVRHVDHDRDRRHQRAPATRQIVLPTSSATSNAPSLAIVTPTGRPRAWPFASRNPVNMSIGLPTGCPFRNFTNTTL